MPCFTFVAGSVTSCWTVVFRRSKINCIYTLPLSIVFCDNISCVRLFSKMYGRRRKKNQVKHPKLESSITSGSTVRLSAPKAFLPCCLLKWWILESDLLCLLWRMYSNITQLILVLMLKKITRRLTRLDSSYRRRRKEEPQQKAGNDGRHLFETTITDRQRRLMPSRM